MRDRTFTEFSRRVHRIARDLGHTAPAKPWWGMCLERLGWYEAGPSDAELRIIVKRIMDTEYPVTCSCQAPDPAEGVALCSNDCHVHNTSPDHFEDRGSWCYSCAWHNGIER